ncbi:BQ5605_C009g05480 [Microbotryum silenes-dioicae]|uniref:BQ5605_C009g05480 protein n=1 Tax=Microbotryum silenes-dioicae TaxID=796604 RepID=A0A2X0PER4_9BASI|nr:BQ5605_C009g05480 [Microbotryum silenes-dioicae]
MYCGSPSRGSRAGRGFEAMPSRHSQVIAYTNRHHECCLLGGS